MNIELTVPIIYMLSIIYMLLWSEYNYHHALEALKIPLWLISEKTIFNDFFNESFYFIPMSTFFMNFHVASW